MENITHKLRFNGLCVIMAAAISLPGMSHAAVIDQVKNRVDAIKSDTSTLKNKTTKIQKILKIVLFNISRIILSVMPLNYKIN